MEDPIREGVDILVEVLVILAVGIQGNQLLSQMEETRTQDPTATEMDISWYVYDFIRFCISSSDPANPTKK